MVWKRETFQQFYLNMYILNIILLPHGSAMNTFFKVFYFVVNKHYIFAAYGQT